MHTNTQLFSETGLKTTKCACMQMQTWPLLGAKVRPAICHHKHQTGKAAGPKGLSGGPRSTWCKFYTRLEVLQPTRLVVAADEKRPTRPKVCCLASVGGGGSPYTVVTGDKGSSCQLSPYVCVASWAPASGKCTRGSWIVV